MTKNFGDWQWTVYGDAVHGISSRFPFDFESIERKAFDAMPDWVYRYVSAAAGDGRTQRANIAAYSRYGIIPRMMVSPPERDLSITLFGQRFDTPIFMCPIGLIGLCAPDFQGDIAAAQAAAATGVPFTLSTFAQAPMEQVSPHTGATPIFFQLYLPNDRELAASLISRAEASSYSALMLTVDTWALGVRPADLQRGNFPQFRGFCMENYYSDENFTKHLAKPPREDQPAALQLDARAPARHLGGGGLDPGHVRRRGAGCDGRHYRAGDGRHRRRPRPAVRLRAVLWRRRKPDPLPEVVSRRTRPVPGGLRLQG